MGRIQRYPIFYSNRFEKLAEFLGEQLFSSKSFVNEGELFPVFQKRIVIVPAEPIKRFLALFFASHPHYRVTAGVQWKTLSEGLSELFPWVKPDHKIPSFFELSVRIEEVISSAVYQTIELSAEDKEILKPLREYLCNASETGFIRGKSSEKEAQALTGLSVQVAQGFFQYGLYGADFLPQWLENIGWQQWIWKRIYARKGHWQFPVSLYRNNLKNRFLAASDLPQNSYSHSRLAIRQWSLDPNANFENPPCQNFDSSSCFGIAQGDWRALPFQLHLFGFQFLPRVYQNFFHHLGAAFYQISPCAMFWEDTVAARDRIGLRRYFEKRQVKEAELEQWENYVRDTHPLLANWGKLGRAFIQQLERGSEIEIDTYENYETSLAKGVLARVQSDFLQLHSPQETATNRDSEPSIEVHSAPSAFREVEVLYDLLLQKIQSDSTVTSKDILVLSPQLDRYTPFIETIFGAPGSLFSYSVEQIFFPLQNEIVGGLFQLLEIAKERFSVNSILKLFSFSSFLKRWGFSSQDVRKIKLWIEAAGGQNAIERWLMSLMMRASTLVDGVALGYPVPGFLEDWWPCGGVDISDIDLLNQWYIFLNSLETDLKPIVDGELKSLCNWLSLLEEWVLRYFGESEAQRTFYAQMKRWDLSHFEQQPVFSSAWLNRWLQEMFQNLGHKGNLHQLQRISFFPLKPGNVIPAKVICLLGMDESAFPKRENPFVLSEMKLQKEWIPTRLEEDRYLFLEVLTLAKEHLIISYEGLDPKDHQRRAASSLVQELLLTYPEIVQIDHPAFPFSEKYLPTERFYRCAHSLSEKPSQVKPFYLNHLTVAREKKGQKQGVIAIKDLALLAKHPLQFYFQKGHQIFIGQEKDQHREIILSFRQQAVLRNKAFHSTKEGIPLWKLKSQLPKGIFGEVATQTLEEELEKRENYLRQQGVSRQEGSALEFSVFCDTPSQIREHYWTCPAPRFSWPDGTEVAVTGVLEGVTSKGLLFHGEDRWEERIKYWPQWLLLAQRQGIPSYFPALLLSTQPREVQNELGEDVSSLLFSETQSRDYLQRYLNYYREALSFPSLLMPSWMSSFFEGSFESFEKQRTLSLGGHLFTDEWLLWVERMCAWPPLKESFAYWSDYSKVLYPEGLCDLMC